MNESLAALKADNYRIGHCQILLYDRKREDIFPPGYLTKLWQLCRDSGRRSKLGILPNLFCGMPDLSHDAITNYLACRPVMILGVWTGPETFQEAGLAFPSTLPMIGNQTGSERAAFLGYGLFSHIWGQPEAEILGILGLAYFFNEFSLSALHGLRYIGNGLTAKFTRKFGFVDDGLIPRYMMQDGKLVGAICSTLLIEDFERYLDRRLVELLRTGELDGRQGRIVGALRSSSARDALE